MTNLAHNEAWRESDCDLLRVSAKVPELVTKWTFLSQIERMGQHSFWLKNFEWFHETLYIFVSYAKEFPEFLTVTLDYRLNFDQSMNTRKKS